MTAKEFLNILGEHPDYKVCILPYPWKNTCEIETVDVFVDDTIKEIRIVC